MRVEDSPLISPPPQEVALKNAPLIRVITQVRFPLVVSVENRDFIAPFQEAIRNNYPVLRPEISRGVVLGAPSGAMNAPAKTIWRFSSVDSAWRVSLASDFVALETTEYTSRDDFLERLREVLIALGDLLDLKVIDRVGVRYIDRVEKDLGELPILVRPEVAGIAGMPFREQMLHSITESVFELPNESARMLARWGLLPEQGTFDPAAIEPIDMESWLLDLDVFVEETVPFNVDETVNRARKFSERIYTFFRWAVTDDFLKRYGGEL